MEMLHDARDIYRVNRHSSGLASVAIHMGHLYLESGEIEAATHEAEAVIKLAEEKNDPTLHPGIRARRLNMRLISLKRQSNSLVRRRIAAW